MPSVKKSHQKTTKQLLEARDYIEEIKSSYQSLQEKLNEREEYFNKREAEMQEIFNCELTRGKLLTVL
jgi:peptidoglycan hydrolase CwlO-like protein